MQGSKTQRVVLQIGRARPCRAAVRLPKRGENQIHPSTPFREKVRPGV